MTGAAVIIWGRSLSVHRGTFAAGGWLWYVGGILLLSGLLNAAQLLGVTLPSKGAVGPEPSFEAGAVCLLGAFLAWIVPVLRWRQQVEVFENGFIWRRLTGVTCVQRWQVRGTERIQHHQRSGSYSEVVVHLDDGRSLSIAGVENTEQLQSLLAAYARPSAPAANALAGGWSPPVS